MLVNDYIICSRSLSSDVSSQKIGLWLIKKITAVASLTHVPVVVDHKLTSQLQTSPKLKILLCI